MRLALVLTSGLAVLLAASLALQVMWPASDEAGPADATGARPASRVPLPAVKVAADAPAIPHIEEWVSTILARPLFTRDRRPPDVAASSATGDTGGPLPRLSGIAITPGGRRAIFAGADGGKPIVVEEGASIAGFKVQAIGPDGVKVQGPSGDRTVALAFDPTPAATPDQPPQQQPGGPIPPPNGQPGFGQPPGMPPYGQPVAPAYPGFGGNVAPLRPGVAPIDPTARVSRPAFISPRAELGRPPLIAADRST